MIQSHCSLSRLPHKSVPVLCSWGSPYHRERDPPGHGCVLMGNFRHADDTSASETVRVAATSSSRVPHLRLVQLFGSGYPRPPWLVHRDESEYLTS
jgi:hypothetical protein